MANSSVVASSLLAFVSSLVLLLHVASANDVASTICPKTKNPGFCTTELKTAGSADLKALATHTLNLARKKAGESVALANDLAAKATDPQLKERYTSCSKNFDEAIGNIETAEKHLASGDYNGVNLAGSAVMSTVDDCRANFETGPADTSSLSTNGKTLDDISSIILVISNLLLQPA
ncbi:pectinesterase inhibitor-like [Momordica charantia]|uniref:Pectinesterase inhibitor-like n=1 Tax=Momordica charantia TaxID=3673 RepID=A0A6J1CAH7_MOMCH|nr:pectinesterase inhibitor-like [Momordica charantia]